MEATWVRIGDVGQATLWQCSACKMIMELRGIYTPYGLGNTECPECDSKIINVNQNINAEASDNSIENMDRQVIERIAHKYGIKAKKVENTYNEWRKMGYSEEECRALTELSFVKAGSFF